MLKLTKTIGAMTLITFMTVSCSSPKEENKPVTKTEQPEPKKEESEVEPVETAPMEMEITKKDTAKSGGLMFLVKNVNEPKINRGPYSVLKPEDDQKYIAVQIWVNNGSTSEISISRDDFKLFDQEDAEFSEEPGFTEHRKKPILFEHHYDPIKLSPNDSKSGWVTFTTDIGSKATKVKYKNITVKL